MIINIPLLRNTLVLTHLKQQSAYKSGLLFLSVFIAALLFLLGCTQTSNSSSIPNPLDPFESMNRSMQTFNDGIDRIGLKPTAKGYTTIVPAAGERAVSNFFSNLDDPIVVVNQLLQGKVILGIEDSARFLFNSSFGLGGMIDIATPMGLTKHEEDFGQTLGVWGMGKGPHLNLPFWGPTNLRDGTGSIVYAFSYPIGFLSHVPTRNQLAALTAVDKRAALFSSESLITGDRYLFIRDAYNQRREFLIKDGVVEDSFLDDEGEF